MAIKSIFKEHMDAAVELGEIDEGTAEYVCGVLDGCVIEPQGKWRHSGGLLFCGTLRVAKEDFDTCPNESYRESVFDNMIQKLNT